MEIIGYIHTDFVEKFGIPRQSGLVENGGIITFEPPYNKPDAIRGLEDFSHIWIIWDFPKAHRESDEDWSPTVRPPRLGGNKRVGVFATRSPFRPNPIGLSCVEIEKIQIDDTKGPLIYVKGADLLDGTPIYDIKPYIPYADCKLEAKGGFAKEEPDQIEVEFQCTIPLEVDDHNKRIIEDILKQDPRPSYQKDAERVYGMKYADFEIKFKGDKTKIVVCDILFS